MKMNKPNDKYYNPKKSKAVKYILFMRYNVFIFSFVRDFNIYCHVSHYRISYGYSSKPLCTLQLFCCNVLLPTPFNGFALAITLTQIKLVLTKHMLIVSFWFNRIAQGGINIILIKVHWSLLYTYCFSECVHAKYIYWCPTRERMSRM